MRMKIYGGSSVLCRRARLFYVRHAVMAQYNVGAFAVFVCGIYVDGDYVVALYNVGARTCYCLFVI